MMKNGFFISIIVLCLSCQSNKVKKTPLNIDVTNKIVIPKYYIVTKTESEVIIDGIANESNWETSDFTDNFIDIEGIKTPKFDTKVKMLWDDDYLYVYSEMQEPHIWADLYQRDTIIYFNNDFEVFIDPSGTGKTYGEIEINALNTVWDLFLDKPYRVGGKANFHWNLNDLSTAVQIHGTLNDPSDIDTLWTVEMAIPLKPLIELKNKPRTSPNEGEQWRINFSRVQWDHDIVDGKYHRKKDNKTYLREYNWVWSDQKVINMHEPEKWAYLQFTEAEIKDEIAFINDPDLNFEQVAFALFRKTRYGDLRYLLDSDHGTIQPMQVTYSEGNSINAMFYKTNFGFEYTVESSASGKIFTINDQGQIKKQ